MMHKNRKYGILKIDEKVWLEYGFMIVENLELIITRCEFDYLSMQFHIVGISERFLALTVGQLPLEYPLKINTEKRGDRTVYIGCEIDLGFDVVDN